MNSTDYFPPTGISFLSISVCCPLTTLGSWISLCRIDNGFARGVSVKRLLALFLFFIAGLPSIALANIGAEWNPTGNPIGGGPGYSDTVRHQYADFIVHNKSQFLMPCPAPLPVM